MWCVIAWGLVAHYHIIWCGLLSLSLSLVEKNELKFNDHRIVIRWHSLLKLSEYIIGHRKSLQQASNHISTTWSFHSNWRNGSTFLITMLAPDVTLALSRSQLSHIVLTPSLSPLSLPSRLAFQSASSSCVVPSFKKLWCSVCSDWIFEWLMASTAELFQSFAQHVCWVVLDWLGWFHPTFHFSIPSDATRQQCCGSPQLDPLLQAAYS